MRAGPKKDPISNVVYTFGEAIAGAGDPSYVMDALRAFYGRELDPFTSFDMLHAAAAQTAFVAWRPPARGLRRWRPAEVVNSLGTARTGSARVGTSPANVAGSGGGA